MSVRVTPAGGLEFTKSMVGLILSTFALVTLLVGLSFKAVGASQQLANATPVTRHDSLVHAVAEQKLEIDTLRRDLMGLNCLEARYPSPFCDQVPRVMQAGRIK